MNPLPLARATAEFVVANLAAPVDVAKITRPSQKNHTESAAIPYSAFEKLSLFGLSRGSFVRGFLREKLSIRKHSHAEAINPVDTCAGENVSVLRNG